MGNNLKLGRNALSNKSANISQRTSGRTRVKACRVGCCANSSEIANTHINGSSSKRTSEFHSCRPHGALGFFSASHCLPHLKEKPLLHDTSPLSPVYAPGPHKPTAAVQAAFTPSAHCHLTLLAASGLGSTLSSKIPLPE